MLQGVVYQNAEGTIISMNPAAERILGKTHLEFLGSSSVGEEVHCIREDGSPFPGLEHPAMVALRTGAPMSGTVMGVFNPREKTYRWIQIDAIPLFQQGDDKPYEVYTLFSDITESKQAERQIRDVTNYIQTLVRISPMCLVSYKATGEAISANDAAARMVGTTLEELEKQNFRNLESWKRSGLLEMAERALRTGTEQHGDVFLVSSFGMRVTLECILVPFMFGEEQHILLAALDITERKQLELDLRAAVAAREDFLSIASHELKTPLTGLHLQLQLMKRLATKAKDDNPFTALCSTALKSSQQVVGLLNELLDVTKIRVGKFDLHEQEVDLKAAVIEGVAALSENAHNMGSMITVKADHSVVGTWDRTRVHQIIANLLSNAIKYGEGKPIEVTVAQEADKLHFQDQGMGIPYDLQSKIFERFERAVTGGKIGGLGLGLYIVRQIVEAHGGSIHVESAPGNGSLFIVELPL
jgi:PAS domain S-box-containing protein